MRNQTFQKPTSVHAVLSGLRHYRFRHTTEAALQDGLELSLLDMDIPFKREYVLTGAGGRIDFYLPTMKAGIEIKVKGGLSEVLRQLHRYAQCPEVTALILVTTRRMHEKATPSEINGKPVMTLGLWMRGL